MIILDDLLTIHFINSLSWQSVRSWVSHLIFYEKCWELEIRGLRILTSSDRWRGTSTNCTLHALRLATAFPQSKYCMIFCNILIKTYCISSYLVHSQRSINFRIVFSSEFPHFHWQLRLLYTIKLSGALYMIRISRKRKKNCIPARKIRLGLSNKSLPLVMFGRYSTSRDMQLFFSNFAFYIQIFIWNCNRKVAFRVSH